MSFFKGRARGSPESLAFNVINIQAISKDCDSVSGRRGQSTIGDSSADTGRACVSKRIAKDRYTDNARRRVANTINTRVQHLLLVGAGAFGLQCDKFGPLKQALNKRR